MRSDGAVFPSRPSADEGTNQGAASAGTAIDLLRGCEKICYV
jgi:hypothetical protein